MLPQQILAIVVPIWRANHTMNVLARRFIRIGREFPEPYRRLMIELDQDYRTLHSVVEDAIRFGAADPCEPGVVHMAVDFVHFNLCMAIVHVAHIKLHQFAQPMTGARCQLLRPHTGIVENDIVFEGSSVKVISPRSSKNSRLPAVAAGKEVLGPWPGRRLVPSEGPPAPGTFRSPPAPALSR